MSTATRTNLEDQIKRQVVLAKDHQANLASLATKSDTAIENLKGDLVVDAVSAILVEQRDTLGSYINNGLLASGIVPLFLELGRVAGLGPNLEYDADFSDKLKADLHANGRTITQRGVTFGAAAAVGVPAGDGQIARLTVDRWGYPLEATHIETKTLKVIQDQNMGVLAGQELFEWRGAAAHRFIDSYAGSGRRWEARARNAAGSILPNSSFDGSHASAGGADKITGWDIVGVDTNVTRDATDYFRVSPSAQASTSASLSFAGDAKVEHAVRTQRTQFSDRVAYQLDIAVKPGTSTGSIVIALGATSRTISLAALPGPAVNGWYRLRLTMDKELYYVNFKQDDLKVSIELTGMGGVGPCLVDDAVLAPMIGIDGTWQWVIGGPSPWLFEDSYTVADTLAAADSVLAYWFWWMGLGSFPSAAPGTWTDP